MTILSLAAFLALGVSITIAQNAIGPVADLHITNKNVSPDGFSRDAVVAEGSLPGPLIRGNMGDQFSLNVIDELTDESMLKSTSIHWHGLFQKGTNWADGPAFVTQCPIVSGDSFLYQFKVPGQAGTFWYHSHLALQYCDGLRGPLVVYDPEDPHRNLYDVDDESTVVTLVDWYHAPAPQLPVPPTAASTLINGLGRTANGTSPLSVITVQHGKRYRIRLVSISCEPNYIFSIDNHNFTVIEADGVSTQALPVDSAQIFAGQRYSLVLNANQPVGNYWIRAQPNIGTTTTDGGVNSAILRYVGAPVQEPNTTQTPSISPLVETNLHPLVPSPVPGKPVVGGVGFAKNLNVTFNAGEFLVNNVSFVPPSVPVLLQILSGSLKPQEIMPSGSIIPLPPNTVVELTIPGGVIGGGHPVHLHGHNFWVVRSAGSQTYNFDNPVIRDVVNIGGAGDNVTIRFETNNPGPWFLHCHIDFHLNAGFAVVFAEDIPDIKFANPVPPAWEELCPKYNATPIGDR